MILAELIANAQSFGGLNIGRHSVLATSVVDALRYQSRVNPKTPFLTTFENNTIVRLNFSQIYNLVERSAVWLQKLINPGETLGLVVANSSRGVVAMLAALSNGNSVLLLDPTSTAKRHDTLIEAVGPELVIDTRDGNPNPEFDEFPQLADLQPVVSKSTIQIDPQSVSFLAATSGSTASSKIVVQSHRAVTSNALAMVYHHALCPGVRSLSCLPISHVNGLHFSILANIFGGSEIVLLEGYDPFLFNKMLVEFDPHIANAVPSLLEGLTATMRTGSLGKSLRYFVSAAAPLQRYTASVIWERWSTHVLQGYGLSEGINFSAKIPRNVTPTEYRQFVLDAEKPSIGMAVWGNHVSIRSKDGVVLGEGAEGEVCIQGCNLMECYLGNKLETEKAFRSGYFHSGDLGIWNLTSEGRRFFTITGRIKNVVKICGETISLEEVERIVFGCVDVLDCACEAISDRLLGERIRVYYSGHPLAKASITESIEEMLPLVAQTCQIVRVNQIPRTLTGKLIRRKLSGGTGQ